MKAIILENACLCSIAVAILLCATGTTLAQPRARLKLNEDAFTLAHNLLNKDTSSRIEKVPGVSIGLRQSARTSSFDSMASVSMQSGVWQSTSAMLRTPNEDTNFPMATSQTFIAVACSLFKVERVSTSIPKSKMQRPNSGE